MQPAFFSVCLVGQTKSLANQVNHLDFWFGLDFDAFALRLRHPFKMVDRIVSWFLFTFVSITRLHSHLTTLRKLLWPHFPRFNQHESFKVWKTGLNGWTGWLSGSYPRQNGGWLTAKKISAKFLSDQNTTSQKFVGKKKKRKKKRTNWFRQTSRFNSSSILYAAYLW